MLATVPLALAFSGASVNFGPDFVASTQDNMNGFYPMSSTPGGTPGLFPKAYKDYPGGVESFDVVSPPMTTLYSQVWWAPLAPSKFPDAIVSKYAGKKMAIVGWEIDQVRVLPDNTTRSVPINANYNHHYVASVIGGSARYKQVQLEGPHDPRAADLTVGHGGVAWEQPQYIVEGKTSSNYASFSSANGGEYRKTYHGFSPGQALVIESPTAMQICAPVPPAPARPAPTQTPPRLCLALRAPAPSHPLAAPMQIDTWNRDAMDIDGPVPPQFVPGPLPRASAAPAEHPQYSALLECPMTTRLTKHVDGGYVARSEGACAEPILTFQECFAAAATTVAGARAPFANATGSDASQPPGCSASVGQGGDVRVFFNTAPKSAAGCAAKAAAVAGEVSAARVRVSVALDAEKRQATLTLSGPADVWFGAAFGAHAMADAPWTVVVDGSGAVSEKLLADHAAGSALAASVVVRSSRVEAGTRTVVLTRPLRGETPQHFSFSVAAEDATIAMLTAVGSGPEYGYHKEKAPCALTLLPLEHARTLEHGVGPGACLCPQAPKPFGMATGQLVYHKDANQTEDVGSGAVGFGAHKCADYPATTLLGQRNPTCDLRHYRGGQWACHHMWSLLDADQPIPWADQPLVFHHKYRFWVQPYAAAYHTPLDLGERRGSALLIGSPWEYDVPKCAPGVPGCSLEGGSWVHTVSGSTLGRHRFAALNFHCHAPTCLMMEVYACAKGTALQDCNATVGTLLCREQPAYGGSGASALNGTRFDEAGYIAIPDCFWGDAAFGLEPPPDLSGVPLHMVKTCNATYGHYGEMAGGQPWVYAAS